MLVFDCLDIMKNGPIFQGLGFETLSPGFIIGLKLLN